MSAISLESTASPSNAKMDPAIDLEKVPVDRVLAELSVKSSQGLSSAEAQQRLAKYGPNALVEKEVSLLRKILGPFTGPIAYMIEAAAIVSAVIGHWTDFAVITGLLFFNAALEFWQGPQGIQRDGRAEEGASPGSNRNARRQVADG